MKMLGKTAIFAIGAGVLIASASAQELRTASENVVACQSVEDSAARLECFETAAAALSAALTAPAPEVIATAPATPTAASPNVPAAPVETAAAATTSTEQAAVAVETAATTTPADPNVPRSGLPSWIPRITFGSDREVEKEPDEYSTQITRIRVNRLGRHFFTTTEGHVWKQRKIEEIRAPKSLPADATLYQNITGGLRIKIEETDRSYGVERIE
ncbi:MAG: hypothetical protein AAGL97_05630 [Pseudomonadota bacterium]